MKQEMYRQGDVLLTRIDTLPEGLTERKSRLIVEGEVTGHQHRLVTGRVLSNAQGALFLEILQATQVVHQEHHPLHLPSGFYQVTCQREYVAPNIDWRVRD